MRTALGSALIACLFPLLAAVPAVAGATPLGRNATVSVDMNGEGANRASSAPSVSARSGYVAFVSAASDLVGGDTNMKADVFVRNMNTGETLRASVDTAGRDANGDSLDPAMSGDGHFLAFTSYASDLVAGDDNGVPDVFVRDLWTGTTLRGSVDTQGDDANGPSGEPSITASGEFLAFSSNASDLVVGDRNGTADVFVRTLTTRTTLRASVDVNGGDPNGASRSPSIAGMGHRVAFASDASDLVTGDGNDSTDVFVLDTKDLITTRASVDSAGRDANGDSRNPAISLSGNIVVFESVGSDLAPGDVNGVSDIFLRDLQATAPILVSVDMDGGNTNGPSYDPSASDSPLMAFVSAGTDLTRQDENGFDDVFLTLAPA
jgi:Tol biopolymer transport system component